MKSVASAVELLSDAVKFLEGLQRGEVIDLQVSQFVQHGIFGCLEERFLATTLDGGFAVRDARFAFSVEVLIFE